MRTASLICGVFVFNSSVIISDSTSRFIVILRYVISDVSAKLTTKGSIDTICAGISLAVCSAAAPAVPSSAPLCRKNFHPMKPPPRITIIPAPIIASIINLFLLFFTGGASPNSPSFFFSSPSVFSSFAISPPLQLVRLYPSTLITYILQCICQ